jgi:UDP-N-acetylmuramyl pentapeptide phosphotransferase/UDP-N-acetylglucosamine-1-phosphate transferase/glycosyltransferase involved in cell wall biosynthesis
MSPTFPIAIAVLASAAASLALTPWAKRFAYARGFVDQPDPRKIHNRPIARLGGVAIALAVLLVSIPLLIWTSHWPQSAVEIRQVIALLIAATLVLGVGVIDDLISVRSTYKLFALLFAAFILCSFGGSIDTIVVRGHELIRFGWLAWPITMLWIVGVTVSINFIDGLDGLAAGIVAIAAAVIAIGAADTGQLAIAILTLCLAGSLAGFLFFNFNPASIFMGDSGSMFIGFLLAGAGVICAKRTGASPGILLPAVVLVVPLLDTNLAFVRRGILQRRSIFAPERGHIHHRLLDSGLCHKHSVILLYGVTIAAAVTALLLRFASTPIAITAVVCLVVLVAVLFRASGSSRGRETIAAIRRNRAISRETRKYRDAFEDAQLRFRNARTFDDWWEDVCTAAAALDFVSVTLPHTTRDGKPKIQTWHASPADTAQNCSAHFNGNGDRHENGNGHGHSAKLHSSNGHGNGNGLAPRPHATPAKASLPIPDRRSGPPLQAEIELANNSTLESAGHRIALFARLMEEYSLATLPDESALRTPRRSEASDPSPALPVVPQRNSRTTGLKVAIVHDFLYTYAGAERVLEQILAVYPQADLFSLFDFLPPGERGFIQDKPVTASFLQRLPFARNHHRAFLLLMPMAIEQFDLSGYDLVISSSYCAAKGVITAARQLHVCYCHTPVRYAWDLQTQYTNQKGIRNTIRSFFARAVFHYIRTWDVRSANGVDVFVSNSQFVGHRVEKTYRRRSTVIHPPVDTEFFTLHEEKEDFYLTASRLVPYKRIDLIVEAFKDLPDKKLIVIGEGPELAKIQALAGPNVRLLGHQPAERLRHYMQLAKGFIFAAEEDFGIVPVEAQACGTPVLAYAQGGALETILPGQTGLFFQEQTAESLIAALREFDHMDWHPAIIRAQSEHFSRDRFRNDLRALIDQEWQRFQHHQQLTQSARHLADQLLNTVEGIGEADAAPTGESVPGTKQLSET